ncbi:uncharacterized protein LOC116291355, partial [Actinia tenebrosa]|uniref:Uncharacterized protein LOC116291355 n=1 Tax=Actinia tenebrosa TaxID=6105 RepID=A0A6P8HP31_ACTTE
MKQPKCSDEKQNLRRVDRFVARAGGVAFNSWICLYHLYEIQKADRVCSCPSSWGHSPKLSPQRIPERLHTLFDEIGENIEAYKPGTRWRNLCKMKADSVFQGHSAFQSSKRRKTSTSQEMTESQGTPTRTLTRIMQFSNSPVEMLCQSMEKANEILTNDGGSFDEIALCKRALSSIKSHFQNLFTRLKLLCEQHGIIIVQGMSNWNVIDTCFGTIQINTQGDVLIDSCVWE